MTNDNFDKIILLLSERDKDELLKKLLIFFDFYHLVFSDDWSCTIDNITSDMISPSGTFCEPQVENESNNWGNRGTLLHVQRDFIKCFNEKISSFINTLKIW